MPTIATTMEAWEMEKALTTRERYVLDHIRQAQGLGSTLKYYASAFSLKVESCTTAGRSCNAKGLWPATSHAVEATRPDLLRTRRHVL